MNLMCFAARQLLYQGPNQSIITSHTGEKPSPFLKEFSSEILHKICFNFLFSELTLEYNPKLNVVPSHDIIHLTTSA